MAPSAVDRLIDAVATAAREHAANTGEADFEAGDLLLLFGAAYRRLTARQRAALWRDPAVADLLELPEYIDHVAPILGANPGE